MICRIIDLSPYSRHFKKSSKKLSIIDYIINSNNHVLVKERYGFRHASSTDSASYTLTNNILTALNNILLVGGIFCDLHKAFDCVNHDILLSKIDFYGISGKANNLITSCLHDRCQRLLVHLDSKNHCSEWESVTDEFHRDPYLVPCSFFYI